MRQPMALAIVAVVLAMSQAKAQTAEFTAQMQAINASVPPPDLATVKAILQDRVQTLARLEGTCIPTGVTVEPLIPTTADRLVLLPILSGRIKNAWTTHVLPEGCNDSPRLRFMVTQKPDNARAVNFINKGDSLASYALMLAAMMTAKLVVGGIVRRVDPACASDSEPLKTGSRVMEQSKDLAPDFYGSRYAGGWVEGWTFTVCGKQVELPVRFTADGQGGARFATESKGSTVVELEGSAAKAAQ